MLPRPKLGPLNVRVPPPPSSKAGTKKKTKRPGIKVLPTKGLEPHTYMYESSKVMFDFPCQPDLSIKVTFTGEEQHIAKQFYPVVWAMDKAIARLSNDKYQLRVADEKVYIPPDHASPRYVLMSIDTNGLWPDSEMRMHIVKNLLDHVEDVVRTDLGLVDFKVEDIHFSFRAHFENPGVLTNYNKVWNAHELIERFLNEEFIFTYDPQDAVTCQGVEQHFLSIWMRDAQERYIDIRPLVSDPSMKLAFKILKDQILAKQIDESLRNGDSNSGKVILRRCQRGVVNYARQINEDEKGEKKKVSVSCFLGMQYKRICEVTRMYSSYKSELLTGLQRAWAPPRQYEVAPQHRQLLCTPFRSASSSSTSANKTTTDARKRGRTGDVHFDNAFDEVIA